MKQIHECQISPFLERKHKETGKTQKSTTRHWKQYWFPWRKRSILSEVIKYTNTMNEIIIMKPGTSHTINRMGYIGTDWSETSMTRTATFFTIIWNYWHVRSWIYIRVIFKEHHERVHLHLRKESIIKYQKITAYANHFCYPSFWSNRGSERNAKGALYNDVRSNTDRKIL